MRGEVLKWRWGLPGCTITVIDDIVTEWIDCLTEDPPSVEDYSDAEIAYDAYLEDLALPDPGNSADWFQWSNADMDTGTETLVSWAAPSVDASWAIEGRIKKGSSSVAFSARLNLVCSDDGYGGIIRTVRLAVQHTSPPTGEDVDDVTWVDESDDLYSDYDAGTETIRLRINLASDNWAGRGKWQRLDYAEEFEVDI